ncbi:metallophosphoesterase domain-containing protein [Rhizobium sp. Kim5]|uniref:metallophosphoesterase family protein n=1 Tax=Rhizobium sp. Kim5 TaxID=2020311 RepID=UPI000A29F185|nr:metallophosphoesterase family protein [Rhizobium sp. Kim5]ARQ58931.1 metallophosphoesterase domain-containing protein [Rhizobium sp. Kim5]
MAFTSQYFTADHHFGHALMLQFRPFDTVEEMDRCLIETWNSVVRDGDIVWHLGDFSYHDEARTKAIFSQLKGRKRLVLGNHDLDNRGDVRKSIASLAWDQPPMHYAECKQDGERVILNHYAQRTWNASVHGSWHFYGHSHGRLPEYGRSRDVGVDSGDVGYAPATFRNLTAAMRDAEIVS